MTLHLFRRFRAGRAFLSALPALLLLPACVTTEQQIRQAEQVDALDARLLRLERAVAEGPAPSAAPEVPQDLARRLADLGQQVEELDGRVRELLGRVDALEQRPAPAEGPGPEPLAALQAEVSRLAERVAGLEARPAAPAAPSGTATSPTTPPAAPSAPAPKPRELYDRAYGLYKQGKYADAREAFTRYLELYPKADLADNAHFWIGESYYDEGQYEKAILAYDKVIQEFPRGDKVASALLKQAFAFDAIGDPVDARILLKKLLREHPSSEQADIARKKLEILGD